MVLLVKSLKIFERKHAATEAGKTFKSLVAATHILTGTGHTKKF